MLDDNKPKSLTQKASDMRRNMSLSMTVYELLRKRIVYVDARTSVIRLDNGKTYFLDRKNNKLYRINRKRGKNEEPIAESKPFLHSDDEDSSYFWIRIDDISIYWHQFLVFMNCSRKQWKKYRNYHRHINHMVIFENGDKKIVGQFASCLQICSEQQNARHKELVHKYKLYGIRISVWDINRLEEYFIKNGITAENAADEAVKYLTQLYPDIQHDYR